MSESTSETSGSSQSENIPVLEGSNENKALLVAAALWERLGRKPYPEEVMLLIHGNEEQQLEIWNQYAKKPEE